MSAVRRQCGAILVPFTVTVVVPGVILALGRSMSPGRALPPAAAWVPILLGVVLLAVGAVLFVRTSSSSRGSGRARSLRGMSRADSSWRGHTGT